MAHDPSIIEAMDFAVLVAKARQGLEQTGSDIIQQANMVFKDPSQAAEGAKRIAGDVVKGVQQAAANIDLGKAAGDARHAVDEAIQHVKQAAASIDLGEATLGVQDGAARTVKTINEAASRINIEQILANAQADAEKVAQEVSNKVDLPGAVRSANGWVENGLMLAQQRFSTFDLDQTVNDAMLWVKSHPVQTALLVANILLLLAPELLTGPLLALAGFGAKGVGGGSLAASWQASAGPIAAGSLFAGLQSAGAAGYGLSIVNGVVQGGAGIAEAVIVAIKAAKDKKRLVGKSK